MSAIIVDEELEREILGAGQTFEIRNSEGKIIAEGKRKRTDAELLALFGLDRWPTEDEMEEKRCNGKWYTTEQVLEHLQGLSQ